VNINLSVECDECSNQTNCRVGMSNRDIQPLKFSCRKCGSLIGLLFNVKDANSLDNKAVQAMLKAKSPKEVKVNEGVSYKITGATEIPIRYPFDAALDFVDLHLDFPVVFGAYVTGRTPYLQAVGRVGSRSAEFHGFRLNIINQQYKKYPQVTRLIEMYIKGFYGPFRDAARKRFKVDVKSLKMEDINAALYTVVSHFVLPFTLPDDSSAFVRKYTKTIIDLVKNNESGTATFLQEIFDTKFLSHLQSDCLKVYKPVFDAELPLRAALFLDVDPTYASGTIAMRVSSQDFAEYREVYKDMAEVLNRQLVLVAGMNNLLKRGDHNNFAKGVRVNKDGKELAPSSLNRYADVSLGNKLIDLDDPWYAINQIALDNERRNAIAHNKIDYDEVTQIITYYPKLEGMEREKKVQIQLLDYMWRMLSLFREVHRLHHLVKCLNYSTLIEPVASLIKRH
jgi:hypothetical protein